MSKSKLSSRLVVGRIALFTVIGSFLLIFMAAGTSAASFSFMDSVKEFLGLRGTVSSVAAPVSAIPPGAVAVNEYGMSWLKVTEPAPDTPKRAASRRPDNEPFYKQAAPVAMTTVKGQQQEVTAGRSYHNDTSPPLREMRQLPLRAHEADDQEGREANKNPEILNRHADSPDTVVQSSGAPDVMPTPIINMNGIGFGFLLRVIFGLQSLLANLTKESHMISHAETVGQILKPPLRLDAAIGFKLCSVARFGQHRF